MSLNVMLQFKKIFYLELRKLIGLNNPETWLLTFPSDFINAFRAGLFSDNYKSYIDQTCMGAGSRNVPACFKNAGSDKDFPQEWF